MSVCVCVCVRESVVFHSHNEFNVCFDNKFLCHTFSDITNKSNFFFSFSFLHSLHF